MKKEIFETRHVITFSIHVKRISQTMQNNQ